MILGEDRVKRLKTFKAKIDPKSIMNPGKVIASGLLGMPSVWREFFEPLLRLWETPLPRRSANAQQSLSVISRPMWPGMLMAVLNAATVLMSATSSTEGDGKAKAPGANGTG